MRSSKRSVGVGVIVIVAAFVVSGCSGSDDDPSMAFPEVTNANEILDYLAGPGAAIEAFRAATNVLRTDDLDQIGQQCPTLLTTTLPEVASDPATIGDLALEVPDDLTANLAFNDVTVRFDMLSDCDDPAALVGWHAELDATSGAFDDRLTQIAKAR